MRRSRFTSWKIQLGGAAVALFLTHSMAMAQPAENPTATAPPASAPAAAAPAATPGPAASTPATGGPKANGLVFQVKFGANLFAALGGDVSSVGVLAGGLMVGYKLGRLTFGLGMEMSRGGYKTTMGGTDYESATSIVLFEPTLEYYLAISNPLALYLTVGIHAGFLSNHQDPGEDTTDTAIGFHGGVGMRYFMHPRFGIGIEGGLRGVWLFVDNDPGDDETYGAMSIYAAVLLTAIW